MFKMLGAGVVGAVGASLLDAGSASATEDTPVLAGETNTATSTTEITTNSGDALLGQSSDGNGVHGITFVNAFSGVYGVDQSSGADGDGGYGVSGSSLNGKGVSGYASSTGLSGVYGVSDAGSGISGASQAGVVGDSNTNEGVIGLSSASDGSGVHGIYNGVGTNQGTLFTSGVCGQDISDNGAYGVIGASNNLIGGAFSGPLGLTSIGFGTVNGLTGVGVVGIGFDTSGLSGSAGVVGDSTTNDGVLGLSSGENGVHGVTSADGQSGVYGVDQSANNGAGVYGESTNGNGVHGKTSGVNQSGVWGEDNSVSPGGYGVYAHSENGEALRVDGVASFLRSGLVSIGAGKKSVTVTGVGLTASSLVLATLQNSLTKVYVESVVPDVSASSFVLNLSKAVPPGHSANVGWFAVN